MRIVEIRGGNVIFNSIGDLIERRTVLRVNYGGDR